MKVMSWLVKVKIIKVFDMEEVLNRAVRRIEIMMTVELRHCHRITK